MLCTYSIAGGAGRYNLALGIMGTATGIGASISTAVTGAVIQSSGFRMGFMLLAFFGSVALLVLWLLMPETKILEKVQATAPC